MFNPIVHGITVKHRGKQYDMGAACLPTENGKGFEMRVVVRKRRKAQEHTGEIWHTGSGKRLAPGQC